MTTTTWTRPKTTSRTTNAALIEHVKAAESHIRMDLRIDLSAELQEKDEKTLQRVMHGQKTLKADLRSLFDAVFTLIERDAKLEEESPEPTELSDGSENNEDGTYKGTSGGICPNCETWQSDPENCLHCEALQEEVRVCEDYAAQTSSEAPQQTKEEAPSNSPGTLEQITDAIPGEPWEEPEADRFLDDKVEAYNEEQRRKAASKGSNGTSAPKVKGSPSTTSKKQVLAGDEPREVFGYLKNGERRDLKILPSGEAEYQGETFPSVRRAFCAAGLDKATHGKSHTWLVLRYKTASGEEALADELRATPQGYKFPTVNGRGGRKLTPAQKADRAEEKAKAKLAKLHAKLKAAQEELAKLQG